MNWNMMQFNRGLSFLEKSLAKINNDLDRLDPTPKLSRFHPFAVYGKVSAQRIGRSITGRLIPGGGSASDRDLPLSYWVNFALKNRDKILNRTTAQFCATQVREALKKLQAK